MNERRTERLAFLGHLHRNKFRTHGATLSQAAKNTTCGRNSEPQIVPQSIINPVPPMAKSSADHATADPALFAGPSSGLWDDLTIYLLYHRPPNRQLLVLVDEKRKNDDGIRSHF